MTCTIYRTKLSPEWGTYMTGFKRALGSTTSPCNLAMRPTSICHGIADKRNSSAELATCTCFFTNIALGAD